MERFYGTSLYSCSTTVGAVVDSGMPLAVRCRTGHDTPEAKFTEAEIVLLPLGVCDSAVDHVLVFSCYLLDSARS